MLHVNWLKGLKNRLLAPWTQVKQHEQMIAGLLLEQAQNGIVLKRLEEEIAGLTLQAINDGLSEDEIKATIAFMLLEIAKGEKQ